MLLLCSLLVLLLFVFTLPNKRSHPAKLHRAHLQGRQKHFLAFGLHTIPVSSPFPPGLVTNDLRQAVNEKHKVNTIWPLLPSVPSITWPCPWRGAQLSPSGDTVTGWDVCVSSGEGTREKGSHWWKDSSFWTLLGLSHMWYGRRHKTHQQPVGWGRVGRTSSPFSNSPTFFSIEQTLR